jgi:hypothetical protein
MRSGWAGQIVNSIFQDVGAGGAASRGLQIADLQGFMTPEYGNSARTYFGLGLAAVRNTTLSGYTTASDSFTVGSFTWSSLGNASGSTNTKVSSPAVPVSRATNSKFYPATANASVAAFSGSMFATINHLVAGGVNQLANKDNAIVLVTHYQRLLNYIEPDYVHVTEAGRIIKTGPKALALELESRGYDWVSAEHGAGAAV